MRPTFCRLPEKLDLIELFTKETPGHVRQHLPKLPAGYSQLCLPPPAGSGCATLRLFGRNQKSVVKEKPFKVQGRRCLLPLLTPLQGTDPVNRFAKWSGKLLRASSQFTVDHVTMSLTPHPHAARTQVGSWWPCVCYKAPPAAWLQRSGPQESAGERTQKMLGARQR